MNTRLLLHLEGVFVFVLSLAAYRREHAGWGLFALLFLTPDLSMIGYAAGIRAGTFAYNTLHTYVGPLILVGYELATGRHSLAPIALIWTAHIGFDRMLGFGLKYPTDFKDTHLSPYHHRSK